MRMRTSMKMRKMITIKIEQILQTFLNNMPQYRPSPMRMKLSEDKNDNDNDGNNDNNDNDEDDSDDSPDHDKG